MVIYKGVDYSCITLKSAILFTLNVALNLILIGSAAFVPVFQVQH